MKKASLCWILAMTLLLGGCARPRDGDEFLLWRRSLAGQTLSFTAEILSLGEEDAVSFTAQVRREGDETALTVLAPDTIQGVSVTVGREEASLCYEELILSLAPWREDETPPVLAPKLFLDALLRGRLLWTGRDSAGRTAAVSLTEGETVTLWRDETGAPLRAEILRDGRTVLTLDIKDWQTKETN